MCSTYTLTASDGKTEIKKTLAGTATTVNKLKGEQYKRLNTKNFWGD